MKNVFLILFLIASSNSISKNLDFNPENLWLYAVNKLSDEKLNKVNSSILEHEFSREYIVSRKDSEKLNLLQKRKLNELKEKLSNVPNPPILNFTKNISVKSLNSDTGVLNLSKIIKAPYLDIETGKFFNENNESRIRVFIPNYPELVKVKVDVSKKEVTNEIQYSIENNQQFKWKLKLNLAKFINNREFQAVIESGKLYSSKNTLIYEFNETRNHQEVIKASNFPKGFSLNLNPIHNFAFRGIRIQEHLIENQVKSKNCIKTGLYKNHQPTVCYYNYFGNVDLIETFVGGQSVLIEIVARGKLIKADKKKLAQILMSQFSMGKSMFDKDVHQWEDLGIGFEINTTAFFDKPTKYHSHFMPEHNEIELARVLQIKSNKAMNLLELNSTK